MQNRIKELREKRGISQADIARRVHLIMPKLKNTVLYEDKEVKSNENS